MPYGALYHIPSQFLSMLIMYLGESQHHETWDTMKNKIMQYETYLGAAWVCLWYPNGYHRASPYDLLVYLDLGHRTF